MEYYNFEKHFFNSIGINLDEIIIRNNTKTIFNTKNKKILQVYWEIKSIINEFRDLNFLESISNFIENKQLFHKDYKNYVDDLIKIINNYLIINNLKLNPELILKQLLSLFFIIVFKNKLIIDIEEKDYLYINKYTIINHIAENLKKFVIFYDENNLYDMDNVEKQQQQKILIVNILNVLFLNKIIIKKNKTTKNEEDNQIITQSYFALKKKFTEYNTDNINLRIFFFKLNMISYSNNSYYKSLHYMSISEIYRPNVSSRKIFNINEELNLLSSLNNLEYCIDYTMFLKIQDELISEYNLEDINEEDLENVIYLKYLETLKCISISIKKQKENSKLYYMLIFFYLKKYKIIFEEKFYLSYYFDFRGRLYSDSVISPIGFKWFRYLYNYGFYNEYELKNIKFYNEEELKPIYDDIILKTDIKYKYKNINEDTLNVYVLVTCFFEIGKIFKTKYLKYYNNKISYLDFVDIGIIEYNNYNTNNLNFKKNLEIIYILNILENWNKKIYKKFIIWKDATASAIQLQTIVYNSHDYNNYYYTNLLDDNYWHDTYYYIIEKFKEELKNKDVINTIIEKINKNRLKKNSTKNEQEQIPLISFDSLIYSENNFNRSSLKKTIMTYNYSATLWTCYKNFLHELEKEEEKFKLYLFDEFQIFFNYLEFLLNDGIFYKKLEQKKINSLLSDMFIKNSFGMFTPDKSTVYYDYFKKSTYRDWKQINNMRLSTNFTIYLQELDEKQIKKSFKPNYIHSLDATMVRIILKLSPAPIITIHDSFGIDILNVQVLTNIAIIAANEINKKNEVKISSKFILL